MHIKARSLRMESARVFRRVQARRSAAGGARADVPGMRRDPPPQRRCSKQSEEHGRELHGISLRRERLWLRPQERNKTGLMEAGKAVLFIFEPE